MYHRHCARVNQDVAPFLVLAVVQKLISTLMELKVAFSGSLIQLRPLDEGLLFSCTQMQLRGLFLPNIKALWDTMPVRSIST